MKRIISLTVQDRSGVLNRVTGLLQRRQFNISSISVGPTET
jgi:acetolactate synthase-1/3 small subunit